MEHGPNVRELICRRMTALMVSNNEPGNSRDSLLSRVEQLSSIAKSATNWVEYALQLIKTAKDNPYLDDDEKIAEAILHAIDESKKSKLELEYPNHWKRT